MQFAQPPGTRVTRDEATYVLARRFRLSAICTVPPGPEWYSREGLGWDLEILGQDPRRDVRDKIGHQQSIELRCSSFIEGKDKFGAVLADALQRMRITGRENPQLAFVDIGHISLPHRVEDRDAARTVGHKRPFGKLVPVQFAYATPRQPHVDAGDRRRDLEVILGHLPCPAAVLNPLCRVVERRLELWQIVRRGGRRRYCRRELVGNCRTLRTWVRQTGGVRRIDGPLRRRVGVAEPLRAPSREPTLRRARQRRPPAGRVLLLQP